MLDPSTIKEYAEAVTGETPAQLPVVISSTNNPVYRIETESGRSYVLKCLEDPGLDVQFELRVNRHLQSLIRTQEVISADSTKPKPRWDVHLPEVGDRAGSLAGGIRPLIAGPCGSGA